MSRSRIDSLLSQLDNAFVREGWFVPLAATIDGLTASQAAWRPSDGTHTSWQLVNHIAFWKDVSLRRMGGEAVSSDAIENDATFGPPGDVADADGWQAAVRRLHFTHAELREHVARYEDDELGAPVASAPGRPSLEQVILNIAQHDAYHGGQILMNRKLQGSWPTRR